MKKILVIVCFIVSFVFAQESGSFIEEAAHEHGVAILNIAQEANTVSVEFISPSFNIVGFEYQPSSNEEKMMVENAITDLEKGLMLFAPNANASCELISASVESEIAEEHYHEALFTENGVVNASHARKHMSEGPIKSVIALADQNSLLYRADGTHTRFDVMLPTSDGFFEYNAAEDGDYVFFTNEDTLKLQLITEDGTQTSEMIATGETLLEADNVFVKALVFELEAGAHTFMISAAGADVVQMVIEAESHHSESAHGDHSDEHHHNEDEAHEGDHSEEEHDHSEAEEGHNEHSEEGHHDEAHSEEEHHNEGEEHEHSHDEGETHSEFHANYEFSCSNIDQLSSFDLKGLFIFYPAIADLNVQYALESGQGAAELNADNSMLSF